MSLNYFLEQAHILSPPISHSELRQLLQSDAPISDPKKRNSLRTFQQAVLYGTNESHFEALKAGLNLDEYIYFCAMLRLRRDTDKTRSSEDKPFNWIVDAINKAQKRLDQIRQQPFLTQLEMPGMPTHYPYTKNSLEERLHTLSTLFPQLEESLHFLMHQPSAEFIESEDEWEEYQNKLKKNIPVERLCLKLNLPQIPKKINDKIIPQHVRRKLSEEKAILREITIEKRFDFDHQYSTPPKTAVSGFNIPVLPLDKWINMWKDKDFSLVLCHFFATALYSQYDPKNKRHLCSSLATLYSPSQLTTILAASGFLYAGHNSEFREILNHPIPKAIDQIVLHPSIQAIDPFFQPNKQKNHKRFLLQHPGTLPPTNTEFDEESTKRGLLAPRKTPISIQKYKSMTPEQKELYIPIKGYNPNIHQLERFVAISQAKNTLRAIHPVFQSFLEEGREG